MIVSVSERRIRSFSPTVTRTGIEISFKDSGSIFGSVSIRVTRGSGSVSFSSVNSSMKDGTIPAGDRFVPLTAIRPSASG